MASPKKEKRLQNQKVSSIFDLIEEGAADELTDLAENTEIAYLEEYEEEAQEYIKNQGKYMGISTGYPEIDDRLGSFLPGEMFVLGGDTGHGKSILAANIAYNVYKKYDLPVLFVTLELTHVQSVVRFHNIAQGDDYTGILVQRKPAVSYRDIGMIMQKAKDEGACLVVVDHLHFFPRGHDNQVTEISRITKHFKECAVEHDLPLILLSHVTPKREYAEDGTVKKAHKPRLHNLKNSSAIEQDADMVGFIWRDDAGNIEFYVEKMRSRPLNKEPVKLIQKDWRILSWLPNEKEITASPQLGGS